MITKLLVSLGRRALVALACISLVGCFSLQPIDAEPAPLQQMLRDGRLVKAGDHVRVRTVDGSTHRFRLVAMDQATLQSRGESIPIDQVVELEREKFSVAKTVLLGLGMAIALVGIAAASADWDSIELFDSSGAGTAGGG